MAKTRTAKKASKSKAKAAGAKSKKAASARRKTAKRATKKPVSAKAKKAAKPKLKTAKKSAAAKAAAAKKAAVKKFAAAKLKADAAKAKANVEAKAKAAARKRPVVISAKPKRPRSKAAGGRKSSGPQEVRPLGVLPPSSMKRTRSKPVAQITHRPRPTAQQQTSPPAQGAKRVTEQDMKKFEERLLSQRKKILREMGHLENNVLKVNQRDSSGDLSGYSFHMADAGTDAMEREKAFLFASAEGRALMEINEALRRVYAGEYGSCESCGNPIGTARLEAMPQAKLCVSCKEKEERELRGAV